MSSNTPNLGLLKKDPIADGNETFNIQTMLNDNWDKIDAAVGNIKVPDASLTQKGITQLSSATDSTSEAMAATPKAVKAAMDEALASKQLGVEQKANVVAALNSIGVAASTSETWAQLIAKMAGVIRATGNATAADVLAGKTFSNGSGNGLTGSMPNLTGVRNATGVGKWPDGGLAVYPEKGYQKGGVGDGEIKVSTTQLQAAESALNSANIKSGANIFGVPGKATVVDTADAVLDPQYLLVGQSGYDDGVKKAGTMPNRSAENNHMPGLEKTAWPGDRYFIRPPAGYYNGFTWVTAAEPGLRPENIRKGVTIGGIGGSLTTIEPGDTVLARDIYRYSRLSTVPTFLTGVTVPADGTYRFSFRLLAESPATAYAQVYVNGVPRSPQYSTTASNDFFYDVAVSAGQEIQLYIWSSSSSYYVRIENVELKANMNVTFRTA